MKTVIISMLLAIWAYAGQAQEITQLEEARVLYTPEGAIVSSSGDSFSFNVNENYAGEFAEDPIAFMKANFNIQNFIASVKDKNYDSYLISFRSHNGLLRADFNKHGELVRTSQSFKNILLPLDVRQSVYNDYKGWSMVKNKYLASGDMDRIDKEMYKIKLVKDNKTQNVKIDPRQLRPGEVASN